MSTAKVRITKTSEEKCYNNVETILKKTIENHIPEETT